MSNPILAKENCQLLDQLEEDILNLLKKFRQETGLLVTNINTIIAEHIASENEVVAVRIKSMTR